MMAWSQTAAFLNRPIVRFLAVGGGVAALDFACFMALLTWGVPGTWANVAAMTLGFFAGLWGHHAITFRVPEPLHWRMTARYGVSFGFNLMLGTAALQLLLWAAAPAALAKFITIGVVAATNFVASKVFVFRQP